jgi:hypothetical protein
MDKVVYLVMSVIRELGINLNYTISLLKYIDLTICRGLQPPIVCFEEGLPPASPRSYDISRGTLTTDHTHTRACTLLSEYPDWGRYTVA